MGDDAGEGRGGVSWFSQIPNKKLQDQSVVTLIGRKYKATKTKQKNYTTINWCRVLSQRELRSVGRQRVIEPTGI